MTDYRQMIGDDCFNMIIDMKYQMEVAEKKQRLHIELLQTMRKRYVTYDYGCVDAFDDDIFWNLVEWGYSIDNFTNNLWAISYRENGEFRTIIEEHIEGNHYSSYLDLFN